MTQAADSPPPARSRLPLLIGLVLALLLGGGGFYATYSGLLAPGTPSAEAGPEVAAPRGALPTFVPIDPITINLGARGQSRHLRFIAQLEVLPAHSAEVTRLMPRILDVMNTYLRAVDLPELEEPAALTRVRSQMLRRIQLVTGPGRVTDLLITEFVFN
jgi:flagellar protein FliL